MRFHGGYVGIFVDDAAYSLCGDYTDQVVVVTLVPVGGEVDAIFEQAEVDADVQLMLFLISQFAVFRIGNIESCLLSVCKRTIGRVTHDNSL